MNPWKRVKELMKEKSRLETEQDKREEELRCLRNAIEGVTSICKMDKSLGHRTNPEAVLFLIRREMGELDN
jgi:predicted nuclease with TOPRIM domain